MHYKTLVAVEIQDYCISEETDKEIAQQIAELSKTYQKEKNNYYVKFMLSELRALTNSFARAVDNAAGQRLAPYSETDENYFEFFDLTIDTKKEYEGGTDCVKLPDGKIEFDYKIGSKFCIKDGLVYQKNFGQLKQDKRSKKAKRIKVLPDYPFKKLYKTFENFAEWHCGLVYNEERKAYGYYWNSNSFWDWYQIGGRWPYSFLVKEDCKEYAPGEYEVDYDLPEPPEGYKWASAARKKDIQWEVLIEYKKKRMKENYEMYRNAFINKKLPNVDWYLKLCSDGIYSYKNEAVYLDGETFEENQKRRKYFTDSDYLLLPYYYVDSKYWHHCSRDSEENGEWKKELEEFYESLSDNTVLVSVDCHN